MPQDRRKNSNSSIVPDYRNTPKKQQFHRDFDGEPKSLFDYWEVLKRRRAQFWIPCFAITLIAIYLAFSPPSIYRSAATILIEDQEVPEDIAGAMITNYASQQIQLISQRLLTLKNINDVVEKFQIYDSGETNGRIAPAILAERFRRDMELEVVSAETLNRRGQEVETAVAVTLAFQSTNPELAQQVTQELVSLFLSENERSSVSRTSGVSELLRTAVNDANEELLRAEAELAEFKVRNEGALPELQELNINVIDRAEQQLSDVSLRIQQLEQRRLQLSAQLAPLSPSAPVTLPSGETVMSDRDRLRALLTDFRRKSSIYQADHPDLVRLRSEIESLRRTVGDSGSNELLQEQLRQEREKLNSLRDRYSDDHPDVLKSESAIAALESQMARSMVPETHEDEIADNPAYVLIKTQLQSTDLEIRNLEQKRRELRSTIAEHEALLKQAPHVEMQYEALLRRHENAGTKYRDLQSKLRASEVAANVEYEITGRRFTLIEPPVLPIEPYGPDRMSVMIMGLFFAAGVGIGVVVLTEFMDSSVRTIDKLAELTGEPPLVVIPYINNRSDVARSRTQKAFITILVISTFALCIIYTISTFQFF